MAITEGFPFADGSGNAKFNKCTIGLTLGKMKIGFELVG